MAGRKVRPSGDEGLEHFTRGGEVGVEGGAEVGVLGTSGHLSAAGYENLTHATPKTVASLVPAEPAPSAKLILDAG